MRKFALIALILLFLAPVALSQEREWKVQTPRDKRLFDEWVHLCCGVITNQPEAFDRFADELTAEIPMYILFLIEPTNPDAVVKPRILITPFEIDSFQRLAKEYKAAKDGGEDFEPRLREELRSLLVNHVIAILSNTIAVVPWDAYGGERVPVDHVLDFVDDPSHEIKVLGLIMTYRIYIAELDVGRNTLAILGDIRAYDKVIKLGFLDSPDRSLRYWGVKIAGVFLFPEAHEHVARAFRDVSPIIRVAAYRVLGTQTETDAAKAQAGKLLLARFRELLDEIAEKKNAAEPNREVVAVDESIIDLFRRDIGPITGDDGKNGWGEAVAPTVEDFLQLSEKWFEWWQESKYAAIDAPVNLPRPEDVPAIEPAAPVVAGE